MHGTYWTDPKDNSNDALPGKLTKELAVNVQLNSMEANALAAEHRHSPLVIMPWQWCWKPGHTMHGAGVKTWK